MPTGMLSAEGSANSRKARVRGSKQLTFEVPLSQNHKFPSGPSTEM
jgi:hypothetical protein